MNVSVSITGSLVATTSLPAAAEQALPEAVSKHPQKLFHFVKTESNMPKYSSIHCGQLCMPSVARQLVSAKAHFAHQGRQG
jgi:hypothetical protein